MKKAIITGASSGLGKKIAQKLLTSGVKIINLSRRNFNPTSSDEVIDIGCDLADKISIESAISNLLQNHSDADVLICCSGVLHWHDIGSTPHTEIDSDMMINATGMMKLVDSLAPVLKKNKGDIVIVGSTSSFNAVPRSSVYTAAKHAVLGYIKSIQAELKKDDVRVLGIHPGGFQSELHTLAKSDLKQEDLMDPSYIAELIIYCLSLPRNMEISEIVINRKKPQ